MYVATYMRSTVASSVVLPHWRIERHKIHCVAGGGSTLAALLGVPLMYTMSATQQDS